MSTQKSRLIPGNVWVQIMSLPLQWLRFCFVLYILSFDSCLHLACVWSCSLQNYQHILQSMYFTVVMRRGIWWSCDTYLWLFTVIYCLTGKRINAQPYVCLRGMKIHNKPLSIRKKISAQRRRRKQRPLIRSSVYIWALKQTPNRGISKYIFLRPRGKYLCWDLFENISFELLLKIFFIFKDLRDICVLFIKQYTHIYSLLYFILLFLQLQWF